MFRLNLLAASVSALALAGCQYLPASDMDEPEPAPAAAAPAAVEAEPAPEPMMDPAPEPEPEAMMMGEPGPFDAGALRAALDAQSDENKARYGERRPRYTLEFLGITPGMTVVDTLPGGGWYTKILLPYLGESGTVIGAQYPDDIWAQFGIFDEEAVAARIEANATWADTAGEWRSDGDAAVASTYVTDMPEDMTGKVDAVLFIRALHNLNRFNTDGGYLDAALAETYRVLKPGGIVGVVQHRAPADAPDAWADGSAGYLKQDALIESFRAAGFYLEASSEVNANAKDQPSTDDVVWRLPPTRMGTEEGTPERAAVDAIGESDRMTLRFRKPT